MLREGGARVVLVQPTREDLDAMGPNLMSRRNRQAVIQTAIGTVAEQLRERSVAANLRGLPAGPPEKIARPAGPPSGWPGLVELRRRAGRRRRAAG